MGKGKPTKCPVCREQLSSGKALGGHMSKHKKAKARRAATLAAKNIQPTLVTKPAPVAPRHRPAKVRPMLKEIPFHSTPERQARLKEVQARIAGNVTIDMGDATPRVCADLRAAAKRKRDEAAKIESAALAQVKAKRDEANELERLAERIGHIL